MIELNAAEPWERPNDGAQAARSRRLLPLVSGLLQLLQILLPHDLFVDPQRVKVIPGVDARVMRIVEMEANRVVADRLDLVDVDLFLTQLKHALAGTMALYLRRWRIHTKQLAGKAEM
jgi:hypothetical protein